MSPGDVYAFRMRGVEAIEQGNYPEGINTLAKATFEEAKNRDAGQLVKRPPIRAIEPLWIDRIPRVTDEELEEARERMRARYRKPMRTNEGGQLQLF